MVLPRWFENLLPKRRQGLENLRASVILVNQNIVPSGGRRKESIHRPRRQLLSVDHASQVGLRIGEKFLRLGTHHGVLENGRIAPSHFPGMKERGPIDIIHQILQRKGVQGSLPDERWYRWRIMRPIDRSGIGSCLIEGEEFFGATLFVRFPEGCLLFLHLAQIDFASFGIHEVSNHGDSSGGVQYMQDRVTVMGGDLDCRMSLAGRRSADQQGQIHAPTIHFLGDMHHFVQRRRDEATQTHHVSTKLNRLL